MPRRTLFLAVIFATAAQLTAGCCHNRAGWRAARGGVWAYPGHADGGAPVMAGGYGAPVMGGPALGDAGCASCGSSPALAGPAAGPSVGYPGAGYGYPTGGMPSHMAGPGTVFMAPPTTITPPPTITKDAPNPMPMMKQN